jgi:hypothetical protein
LAAIPAVTEQAVALLAVFLLVAVQARAAMVNLDQAAAAATADPELWMIF